MENQLYWTMVGKHFPQSEEIQLLCSEIDQRLALDLPTFTLRERVEEKLAEFMEGTTPIRNPKQKKAVRAVYRDLEKYTYEKEKPFRVDFTLRNGIGLRYTLNDEKLEIYTVQRMRNAKIASAVFERRGLLDRQLAIKLNNGDKWTVHLEDIVGWEASALLHVLFLSSKNDRQIMLQHVARTNRAMAVKSEELEALRNQMCFQIGQQIELVHHDVVQASQALDAKIVEFMRLHKK